MSVLINMFRECPINQEQLSNSLYDFNQEIQYSVLAVLLLIVLTGNSLVLIALFCFNPRRNRMNFFIMQLAIADLLVGITNILYDMIQKIRIRFDGGDFMCKTSQYLQAMTVYASTYLLVALSIDRCYAIINPMKFSGSRKQAKLLVATAWAISFIFSVPMAIKFKVETIKEMPQCWINFCSAEEQRAYITIIFLVVVAIPAVIIAICYITIVLTIWSTNKAMSPAVGRLRTSKCNENGGDSVKADLASRRVSSRGIIPKAKIKSVKLSFVIVFVFVLCWAPYMVFNLLSTYDLVPNTNFWENFGTLVQSLGPLNSAANPIICYVFSPNIFAGLRKVPPFKWLCSWRRGTQLNVTLRSTDSTANSELGSLKNRRHQSFSLITLPRSSIARFSDDSSQQTRNLLDEKP